MLKKIFIPVLMLFLAGCEKSYNPEILKFYGDAFENTAYSIAKGEKGYFIAGQYTRIKRNNEGIQGSLKKLAVVETDKDGNWIRLDTAASQLPSCGTKVINTGGSLVVAGYATQNQQDIYVVKFAPGGEGSTEKVFSMDGNQSANDIIKTQEGYLIIGTTDVERGATGDLGNTKGKKDILILRISEDLSMISMVQTGFIGNDEGMAVKAKDNGFVIVGTTDRYNSVSGTDVFILSANADISTTRFRFIQKEGNQSAADFEVVNDGYFIAGTNNTGAGMSGYTWKITGDILGPVSENEISFDSEPVSVNAICPYKTNSFLMAGQYGSSSSGSMLIFTTDMFGYPVEGKRKIAGGTGNQAVLDIIADGEDVIAVGKNSYENNSMITLLKFRF